MDQQMDQHDSQLYRSATIDSLRKLNGEPVILMRGSGYRFLVDSEGEAMEESTDVRGTLIVNGSSRPAAYVNSRRGRVMVRPGDSLVHGEEGFNVVSDTMRVHSSMRLLREYHKEALEGSVCMRRQSASVLMLPTFFYVANSGERPKECLHFEYCANELSDPCDHAFSIPLVLSPAMEDRANMKNGVLLTTFFPSMMETGLVIEASGMGLSKLYYMGYDNQSSLAAAKAIQESGVGMFRVHDDDVTRLSLPEDMSQKVEVPASFPKCGTRHTSRDKTGSYGFMRLKVGRPMKFRHFRGNEYFSCDA